MEERRYLISDAAKMVAVEAHVLRYWEDELGLSIGRTELGHRYYTRKNIETFQNIKELKEKGLQLKAIRVILRELESRGEEGGQQDEDSQDKPEQQEEAGKEKAGKESSQETALAVLEGNTEKLRQFEELVANIVDKVVKENNEKLQGQIEAAFTREMDYLLHTQESREEERFRKLDEAIRAHQKNARQAAATKEKSFWGRWFRQKT